MTNRTLGNPLKIVPVVAFCVRRHSLQKPRCLLFYVRNELQEVFGAFEGHTEQAAARPARSAGLHQGRNVGGQACAGSKAKSPPPGGNRGTSQPHLALRGTTWHKIDPYM